MTSDPDEKIEHLRKAFAIAPDDRRVLNDLLRAYASRASTDDADRWTRAAVELIQQFNWAEATESEIELETGLAISGLADQAPSKDLRRLLAEASIERYTRAAAIEPTSHQAFNNWGAALSALAKASEGETQKELYHEAGKKYAQALEIKPDQHEALNNWGNALSELAKASEGETQKELYHEAGKKYAQALEIKPDQHESRRSKPQTRSGASATFVADVRSSP